MIVKIFAVDSALKGFVTVTITIWVKRQMVIMYFVTNNLI